MRLLVFIVIFLSITGWGPFSSLTSASSTLSTLKTKDWLAQEVKLINAQADNLNPEVLKLGLIAFLNAHQKGFDNKQLLTIVDYSKPSSERRLWVIDLKQAKVLFNTWVTHGKNSGELNATSFSNRSNSLKSSLGVFVTTAEAYTGQEGYSLRMIGLEPGINDNAYRRSVVVHGATYANPDVVKTYGMLGRSWGCLAVSDKLIKPLIETIKNNTLIIAYYPDATWLKKSSFLHTQFI